MQRRDHSALPLRMQHSVPPGPGLTGGQTPLLRGPLPLRQRPASPKSLCTGMSTPDSGVGGKRVHLNGEGVQGNQGDVSAAGLPCGLYLEVDQGDSSQSQISALLLLSW